MTFDLLGQRYGHLELQSQGTLVKGGKLAHSLALHSQPIDQGELGVELLLPLGLLSEPPACVWI